MQAVKEHRKGPLGGLRRLGTVMSRRKVDPNSIERTPSPEKRSRSSRNPLRRGSSRNMQQIPSPDASTTELPTSPPRQQASVTHDIYPSQPPQPTLSPIDQRRAEPDVNGDIIEPVAQRESSLTNGNHTNPRLITEPKVRPLSTMPEEVISQARLLGIQLLTLDRLNATRKGLAYHLRPPMRLQGRSKKHWGKLRNLRFCSLTHWSSESDQPQFKLDIKSEPIHEEDGDAQAALSSVANTLRAVRSCTAMN